MVTVCIIVFILLSLSGFCKSIKDTLSDHFSTSVFKNLNPKFWEKGGSWLNKYKDFPEDQGPKYPGAKTWLVWTTDFWHFFDMLQSSFWQLSICILIIYILKGSYLYIIPMVFSIKLYMGRVFELFYAKILVRK